MDDDGALVSVLKLEPTKKSIIESLVSSTYFALKFFHQQQGINLQTCWPCQ
jgi:hypothetical protein